MNVGIVGCGYAADFYMTTLPNHPTLRLAGAFDRRPERLKTFAAHHGVRAYPSLDVLLADPVVDMILNLTNPASHFDVSKAALLAGKHVYSEKPLALDFDEAKALVALAEERGLSLSGAPASVLGEAAQLVERSLRAGDVGQVRLVYADLEDGMVFRERFAHWRSVSDAPWPAEDEFRTGCTLEHAGYYLSWMCAFFGPVERITAFASRQVDEKRTGQAPELLADDVSFACLEFASGVVARLSCGLIAPTSRKLRIFGDEGVISVADGWDVRSAVYLRRSGAVGSGMFGRVKHGLARRLPDWMLRRRLKGVRQRYKTPRYPSRMDYARGPAAQAEAIRAGVAPRIDARFVLHVTEVALKIAGSRDGGRSMSIDTRF